MSNDVQVRQNAVIDYTNIYRDLTSFEGACKMAATLAKSTMIPKEYQGNPSNTLIALEMSQRLRTSPLMVMQSLNVIYGRPSWASQFIIANINNCDRFKKSLQYMESGKGDDMSCYAWTIDQNDEKLVGPTINIEMAKKEGWYDKNGSKWKTMPQIMLRYRAASFFGKMYCPELLIGIQSKEEIIDIADYEVIEDTETAVENEIKENANKEPVNFEETSENASQKSEKQEQGKTAEKQKDIKGVSKETKKQESKAKDDDQMNMGIEF
nr:MAG TPA: RecT protein [Caudoviricetes sp.]